MGRPLAEFMSKRAANAKEIMGSLATNTPLPNSLVPVKDQGTLYKDELGDQMAHYSGARQQNAAAKARLTGTNPPGATATKVPKIAPTSPKMGVQAAGMGGGMPKMPKLKGFMSGIQGRKNLSP